MKLSPADALKQLEKKTTEPIEVDGTLDLRKSKIQSIDAPIKCDDFDATGTPLKSINAPLTVFSRLVLDNCKKLETLPEKLKCGSLSLRACSFLQTLPEKFSTWFLDLTDCRRFSIWPKKATLERGIVRLRNCIELQSLPKWMTNCAQLDLSGCVQLTEVPATLNVSAWIDVGGTGITGLPENLANAPVRWRGVPINHRIAFDPDSITAKEVVEERNAEIRRVMIERMGYLRFSQEVGAKVLDTDTDPGGQRQLLRVNLNDDEPLVGLACSCPSTNRQYFLRVPPEMKTCHQAAAWMAGFDDPKKYKPVIET